MVFNNSGGYKITMVRMIHPNLTNFRMYESRNRKYSKDISSTRLVKLMESKIVRYEIHTSDYVDVKLEGSKETPKVIYV